jgi:hypothetical protein
VNAPGIGLPQDVTAAQGFPSQAIPLPSLDSAPPESAKPAPVFNDNKDFQVVIVADKSTNPPTATVSAGAKVIEVCNTLAGARIRIYADDGSGGQIEYGVRVAFGGCRRIDLDRAIEADHPPLAEQWLCDGTPKSPPSTPVKIAQAVRDPKVEQPICAQSRTVTVLGTEPGAYVELQVKASGQPTFEGRGGTTAKGPVTDIDASVTLKDGDEVRVRQLHDGQPPSGWASAPVGGPPRNDHNPGVLRFYRGQTVRFRAVRCGAREAAGTVRMTPPAGSGKPQFMLPLQETKPGYVEAAWHIPLHANDAPAGEYAAQFVIPAENPPAIAFSIGFSAEDIAAILAAHNQCRAAVKEVQLPPLAWSDDLAAEAQAWANHLASDVGKLVHHDGGENLLMWWPIGSRKPADAVEEDWCDDVKGEKSKFIPPCAAFGDDCSTTKKWDDIGHYTQVVWGQTRHVGGGLAQDPVMGCEFLVLRYDPPGNVRGKPVFAV